MDEQIYIVAPHRSISTKVGIKEPGKSITRKECGKNFEKFLGIGWIVKKDSIDLSKEKDIELSKADEKEEEKIIEKMEIKISKKENKKGKSVNPFGISKKEENTEDKNESDPASGE